MKSPFFPNPFSPNSHLIGLPFGLIVGFIFCFSLSLFLPAHGQKQVFIEDFSTPASSAFSTTNGLIPGTYLSMLRSGGDMGARVNAGKLQLTNDASAASNVNGFVFVYQNALTDIGPPYNAILSSNKGIVVWDFNMQQTVAEPTGFSGAVPYGSGVAYILASNSTNGGTLGSGYALILGNSGLNDELDIVRFSNGLQNGVTSIIQWRNSCSGQCLPYLGTEDLNIRVTYSPRDGTWKYSAELTNGTTVPAGTGVDNTHTGISMPYFGFYWQAGGGTAKSSYSSYFNVSMQPYEPNYAPLSYNQNFGSSSFVVYPSAFEGWAGLSGAVVNTQALAETTPASINCDLINQNGAFASPPVGGLFGYANNWNGKIAIGTTSNSLQGVNQPIVGVSADNTVSQFLVSYDLDILYSGDKPTGNALVYKHREGITNIPWTPVLGSAINFGASPANGEKRTGTFMIMNNGVSTTRFYNFRWATWRNSAIGTTSSTLGMDNVKFTALASPASVTITSTTPATTSYNAGASNVILQRIDLNQNAAATSAYINALTISTSGIYSSSDLLNLKVRYSSDATLSVGDPTLAIKTTGLDPGTHPMSSFTSQLLPAGNTGYLFITTDLSPTTSGRYILCGNIKFDDIGISGASKLGISPLEIGNQQFILKTPELATPPTSSSILTTAATLSGNILYGGGTTVTKRGFFYSTTNGFADGAGTEVSTTGSFGAGVYSQSAGGLTPNTIYYFKSFATNSIGTTYSIQGTFTTPKLEPTNAPTVFACSGSGLNSIPLIWTDATGAVVPDGYLISWSPTSYAAINAPSDGVPVNDNSFNLNVTQGVQMASINNLTYNQTYFFKIFSYTNSGTNINYQIVSFGQTTCATLSGQTETFEIGTKTTASPAADVTCVLGSWNFDNALIGTSFSDRKIGLQSARLTASGGGGRITMNFDIENGVSTVSVKHARYGASGNGSWILEYSLNQGGSWSQFGGTIITSSTTLTIQGFNLNQPSKVRFRITNTSFISTINIDDILFVPYCSAPEPTSSVSFLNISETGLDASWGSPSGNGTMLVIKPFSLTLAKPVLGTSYTPNLNWASAGQIDVNNRVVFRAAGSSAPLITGLSAETQYSATAYNYFTTFNCYQRDGAASASYWTLSPKPSAHSGAFSVYASSDTKSYLSFSPASSITNADGYILLQKTGSVPTGLPTNGMEYTLGATLGDASVAGIIPNTFDDEFTVTGLTPNTLYYFELIPYNWNGTNAETYNYRTDATIPMVSTTTSLPQSVLSDIIAEPTFSYTSNINFAANQGVTANTTGGTVGVFKIVIRDGGGNLDADAFPTIPEVLILSVNIKNAIRAVGLFGGVNQSTFITSGVVGSNYVAFTNLSALGALVTAPDGESLELTIRVTFKSAISDNTQLQFSIDGFNAAAFPGASSQFYEFPGEKSSTEGDRNRLEVIATKIAFDYEPDDRDAGIALSPFSIVATDTYDNVDLDENTCTVALTKAAAGGGTMTAPGSPYTFVNGYIVVSDVTFSSITNGAKILATAQSCLGNSTSTSHTFDITGITYVTGDYRSNGNNWNTVSHWQVRNGVFWNAASSLPGAANNVYIQNPMTCGVNATVTKITVLSGGTLTIGASAIVSANAVIVKTGGSLVLLNDLAISGTFEVEDDAAVTINFAATNLSNLWNGNEFFFPNSTFIIKNWGVSASPSSSRILYTNQISTPRRAIFFGKTGPSAPFGNLTIDLTTNLGATLFLTDGSSGKGLTNRNLTVKSTNSSQRISYFGSNTSGYSAVGGDLIVDAAYNPLGTFQISGTGSNELEVFGNMNLNGGKTVLKSYNGSISDSISVYGNLTIGAGANLLFNEVASSGTKLKLMLEGDLSVNATGNLGNFSSSSAIGNYKLQFSGKGDGLNSASTQEISIASTSTTAENVNISFEALSGSFVRLINQNFELGQNSQLKIYGGSTFDFGYNGITPLQLSKSGASTGTSFITESSALLKISSSSGLNQTGPTGNVLTDTRSYSDGVTYWYTGLSNQLTGDGLPAGTLSKTIICDLATNALTLSTQVPLQLPLRSGIQIRKGIFVETTSGPISGDGYLTMTQGTYRSEVINTLIPNLTDFDRFSISPGTFEMAGSGNQALSNLPSSFQTLKISGTGAKTLSESIVLNTSLEISDGELNIGGFRITGSATLNMTGGTFKMGYSGADIYPELFGEPYSLTGGTIELYGSSPASGSQILRTFTGPIGSPVSPIVYNNLKINASESNFNTYNVEVQSSLQVSGNMEIFYPAVFYLNNSQIVSGTGTFTIQPKACLKYEEKNGLTPAACGTGILCGQIRTTNRSFSTSGRYWISGNELGTVTGSGLPDSVHSLMINRTGINPVALTNDVTVNYFLGVQNSGMLETGSKKITLSDTAVVVEEESAHVLGKVETTRTVDLTRNTFGGIGLEIDADGASPGLTTVVRSTGTTATSMAIKRKFSISPAVNSGLDATLTIHYFDDELDGLDENNFKMYRSTDAGVTWVENLANPYPDENKVDKSGINAFSEWTVGDVNVPLPLSLISFTGKAGNGQANLFWKTASEVENTLFTVYRSTDGRQFDLLETISGSGNRSGGAYKLTDFDFQKSYFYKLVAIGSDTEKEVISKVIFLNCACGDELKIILFPNPSSGKISFQSNQNLTDSEVFELELIGMDGRRIYSHQANLNSLETLLNQQLSGISSGLYQIKLHNERFIEVMRFRKI